MKGDPAVVETAGSLVILRGLGDFGAERVFSIGCVFDGFKTVIFDVFTYGFTHEKWGVGRSQIFFVEILHLFDAGMTAHLSKPIEISALEGILIEM